MNRHLCYTLFMQTGKRFLFSLLFVPAFLCFVVPVFAQTSGDFYGNFRESLQDVASTKSDGVRSTSSASLGDSEVAPIRASLDSVEAYGGYNAGSDRLSGHLATGVVFLGLAVIILLFWLVLSSKHPQD